VLQCVAVCCSVLQCVAVCCSVLQCVAVCCSVLQCVAVCCGATSRLCMCTCEVSFAIFALPDNLAAPATDGGDGDDEMAVWGSDYIVVSIESVAAIYRVSCSHI